MNCAIHGILLFVSSNSINGMQLSNMKVAVVQLHGRTSASR